MNRPFEHVNKTLLGWLPPDMQDRLGMLRRYSLRGGRGHGTPIVARVDGTTFHGGLTDRWKGLVSLYALAKVLGRDFRIYYTYPFDLEEYQVPNLYDWRLRPGELSTSLCHTRMLRLAGDPTLSRVQHLPADKQIHAYANRDWLPLINEQYGTSFRWGELFRELFVPSDRLRAALDVWHKHLLHPYMAVAFRTQNLLGDYVEYAYPPAGREKQADIIARCLDYLQRLHQLSGLPLLVTSDSRRLSEATADLPFVTATTGVAAHVDTVADAPQEQYMKSFVDFYLLAEAQSVFCAGTEEMYPSDFPKYAAMLYNHPFQRVLL
ncbi:MAG: hypothetical protein IJ581_05905 [Paludibacteraceae bacterium]|nr:hypothetical protein [Paludibacteraceae bacterium]